MPSLRRVDVAVICVMAEPSAIDGWEPKVAEGRHLRTAADEVLIVAAVDAREAIRMEAQNAVAAQDADALVADVTDGWTAWELDGDDARSQFARLTALDLPAEGWVQGDVARVAAKVLAETGRILILVPSFWSDHVRNRILVDTRASEVSP